VNDLPAHPAELRVEDVTLDFAGTPALIEVTMAFSAGVPVAVTGPSGSGKSALCFVLAGAVEPTQGSVLFEGRPISPATREEIGLVLQVHGLVSGLTAIENVALPLQARRAQPHDVRDASVGALALVGLADDGERLVDELSGGERQRVGIARALAGDPRIVIADEPTAARVNASGIHTDFMIGSAELSVDGVTAAGDEIPILREGAFVLV